MSSDRIFIHLTKPTRPRRIFLILEPAGVLANHRYGRHANNPHFCRRFETCFGQAVSRFAGTHKRLLPKIDAPGFKSGSTLDTHIDGYPEFTLLLILAVTGAHSLSKVDLLE